MTLAEAAAWWRRIEALTIKELIQLSRATALMGCLIYLFTIDIYAAGQGVCLTLNNAATMVLDSDHSAASRELIYRFGPPHFKLEGELAGYRDGIRMLDRGEAMVILDVPPGFHETLLRGHEPARVQMQVDTTHGVTGLLASSYGAQIVGQLAQEISLKRLGAREADLENAPIIEARPRIWYNPNENAAWFMSIAELLTVITMVAILLPAATLVRETERGAMEQLLVSALSPAQIWIPKVLAVILVISAGAGVSVFAILKGVFAVPVKGSLGLFFTLTALYVVTTAGLGLAIATLARNLAQVGLLTVLVVAPMLLLSGIWTPPEAMPPGLREAVVLSPLHHFIDISYGILLKGAGMDLLWDSVLSLAALGGAAFGLGIWRFRRQFGLPPSAFTPRNP